MTVRMESIRRRVYTSVVHILALCTRDRRHLILDLMDAEIMVTGMAEDLEWALLAWVLAWAWGLVWWV